MYLRASQAFAAHDLDPAKHWYPAGYALLGAPFMRAMPMHPFYFVDLACLCAAFLGFAAVARRFGVGLYWSFALFLLPFADHRMLDSWVAPWSSTPVAAMLWLLLALVGAKLAEERPRLWRVGMIGVLAALVAAFRPTDLVAAGCIVGVALVHDLVRRQLRWQTLFALAAGGGAVLAAYVALYWSIYGWHLSGYMAVSRTLGFYFGNLGFKAYVLLIDPQSWFGFDAENWHQGLLLRAPWLVLGLAGFAVAPLCLRGPARWLAAALIVATVAHIVLYLSYTDLLATGIWRYWNIHYLKWLYPGMALLGLIALRELATGRRYIAFASVVAALLVTSVRIVPKPAAANEPYRMAEVIGPRHSWTEAYFELPTLQDSQGRLPTLQAVRATPLTNGLRVWAIRRDMSGPLSWAPDAGDGLGPITGQRHFRAALRFGWPCYLVPRSCSVASATGVAAP
jgi:hypothetical protein